MRAEPGQRGLGVPALELQLDIDIQVLEALVAADLVLAGAEKRAETPGGVVSWSWLH